MQETAFVVFCGLSLGLLLLPAPWHFKARNSGTLLFILWAFLGNLVYMINAIIWAGNISNPAPLWCDITAKLIVGFNVALPCASLCIQRRLYSITRVAQVGQTHEQKRRDMYIDLSIGLGFPGLIMALHYIVQSNRYDILEDYGCWPVTYPGWPSFVLIAPWPAVISAISIMFSILTFKAFLQRRSSFNELLKSQGNGMNVNRYFRLMALASIEVLFVFPMALVAFIRNITKTPIQPWHSWDYVHADWMRIGYFTRFAQNLDHATATLMEITRWCMPFSAILFFVFFGLASEARKQYRQWWYAALKPFGIQPPRPNDDDKDTPLTPTTARTMFGRRDTSSSFPLDKKGRPDTFAWLEEGLPYEGLRLSMPKSPDTTYSAKRSSCGHVPNTPSTSTSYASTDDASTLGRHASISTARTGKTARFSQDDDATICGVPTSLKRSDSMDKPLPEIPFPGFADFRLSQISARQSQFAARQSAAESDIDPQVQILVSSPTSTAFERDDEDDNNNDDAANADYSTPTATPARSSTPAPATATNNTLAPPVDARPLSMADSVVSRDGGETVFFTPSPGRLSLGPLEYEVTPEGTRIVYTNEEGQRVSYVDPTAAQPAL